MTNRPEYQIMHLFINKVAELESSRFLTSISRGCHLDISIISNQLYIASIRPDQDNINGFILPFRFFIQKKDGISFIKPYDNKIKEIFDSDLVTEQQRERFCTISGSINSFLSESTNILICDENISNKNLMETFIFGLLSHANKDKAEKLKMWMQTGHSEFLWHRFLTIIITLFIAAKEIRDMFKLIVEQG